jgi:hypothetical protein
LTDPVDMVELAIVLEELGRATDPTPYLATMTQFAPFAPEFVRDGLSGAAVYEGVSVGRDAGGWVLRGTARHILDGDRADQFAVLTPAGVFVPAAEATVRREAVFDPVLHLGEVSFAGVRVRDEHHVRTDPERARYIALTGLALTMVGASRRVLDLVLEHVRTRQQFGVPIGSFQAVKHKEGDPRRRLAASMAKAAAGECQSLVFRHGMQNCPARCPSPGRTTFSSRSSGPNPASCCPATRPNSAAATPESCSSTCIWRSCRGGASITASIRRAWGSLPPRCCRSAPRE